MRIALRGYVLGVEIFGRGEDFEPAVDAIVRVEIGRLRTKLREYYNLHGHSHALFFDFPKGSYALNSIFRDVSNS